MSEPRVKSLGLDQLKWLNKYMSINLNHWRMIVLNNRPEWVYVGELDPGQIILSSSKKDDAYFVRRRNLESNRYFYWPSE